jgi:hypothetical protein
MTPLPRLPFSKFHYVLDIRAPPLVSALLVITHDAGLDWGRRQQLDRSLQCGVDVLILVYHGGARDESIRIDVACRSRRSETGRP